MHIHLIAVRLTRTLVRTVLQVTCTCVPSVVAKCSMEYHNLEIVAHSVCMRWKGVKHFEAIHHWCFLLNLHSKWMLTDDFLP